MNMEVGLNEFASGTYFGGRQTCLEIIDTHSKSSVKSTQRKKERRLSRRLILPKEKYDRYKVSIIRYRSMKPG